MKTDWRGNLAVFLSVAVCPGLGQCVQRRWLAGLGYGLVFGAACVWFFARAAVVMDAMLAVLLDQLSESAAPLPEAPSVGELLLPFALVLVIYVLNVTDVVRARRRAAAAPAGPPPPA